MEKLTLSGLLCLGILINSALPIGNAGVVLDSSLCQWLVIQMKYKTTIPKFKAIPEHQIKQEQLLVAEAAII